MIYDNRVIGFTYRHSPVVFQDLLVSTYGYWTRLSRRTAFFRQLQAELELTQTASASDLAELQNVRLRRLIAHAYDNVRYYRKRFDERGLKPADIRDSSDLYKLPVMTKHDIRDHFDELTATNVQRARVTIGRTGGTTGTPLRFLLDRKRVLFDHALIQRHWGWAGYGASDRVAILRGLTLVDPNEQTPPYWRHDYVSNRLYVSGFHLKATTIPEILRKLNEWRPAFLAGYPSSIFVVARYLKAQNARLPVRAVFTSSEVLTPIERQCIEDRFQCKVWDRYGTGERLVVSQQCEMGNYHQNSEFGILHVDDDAAEPCSFNKPGRLVHTGLTNFSMPLIRYLTDDIGSLMEGGCACGRGLPLMGAVSGRKDDVIITPDGREMPRAGLDQIYEFVDNVERCQLVQTSLGEIIVKVLPRGLIREADRRELVTQLRRRIGAEITVRIEIVDTLPLTGQGKERFIVSHLNSNRVETAQTI